jgi:hypothetical protein
MDDEELFGYLDAAPKQDEKDTGAYLMDEEGNTYFDPQGRGKSEEELKEGADRFSRRQRFGLEGDKLFDYASRLADTAAGKRKTQGQIDAERALQILTGAQRGMAASSTGFDVAQSLQQGERAAQRAELEGEAQISAAAKLAQQQAGASLEQLLIAGEQRAADKAMAMAQIQQQVAAAESSMFGDVLSGIFGAVGAIAGGALGGPAGAAAGGAGGRAFGGAIGRFSA